ncbi:unnamed protein product, partial [Sphagnum balticum]
SGKFDIINNKDFYSNMSVLEFVRDIGNSFADSTFVTKTIGKHFRMGVLIHKESVTGRMNSPEGISFMEFSYQLFQAYDFLRLYQERNCVVQIGGSDQWGNITNGCDLIKKVTRKESYAMTTPLLLSSTGKKFGKSEGNAIWLNPTKTSSYDLFQYLFNLRDEDTISLLKSFTFIPLHEISQIEKELATHPEQRKAQKILAETIIDMLEPDNKLKETAKNTNPFQIFFTIDYNHVKEKSAEELMELFDGIPRHKMSEKELKDHPGLNLIDLVVSFKLKSSKTEIRRLVTSSAFHLNGEKMSLDQVNSFKLSDTQNWLGGRFLVLKFGKKEFHLVEY